MNLVLLGPPGAGKGTQAVKVAVKFDLEHMSSGDILRAERKAATELGRQALEYMDRGVLVPDDLILAMMVDHIGRVTSRGFLLDGFPRTLTQAQGLDSKLKAGGQRIDAVLSMDVDDEIVTRRLTGRATCPNDGRIYHDVFSPPKVTGLCDDCGAELSRRKDDDLEVVGQRLRTYHEQTKPLVDYYAERGVLKPICGDGAVEDVAESIERACQDL